MTDSVCIHSPTLSCTSLFFFSAVVEGQARRHGEHVLKLRMDPFTGQLSLYQTTEANTADGDHAECHSMTERQSDVLAVMLREKKAALSAVAKQYVICNINGSDRLTGLTALM